MTVNLRLKQFIQEINLTQEQFAQSITAKQNQLGNWLGGEKIPAQRILDIISTYKELNARWLITGEGEMLDNQKITPTEDELMEYGGILLDRLLEEKGKASAFENEIKHLNLEIDRLRKKCNEQDQPKARAG